MAEDAIMSLLRSFFGGEYASPYFQELHRQEFERHQDPRMAADIRRQRLAASEEASDWTSPREEMLMMHEMSKASPGYSRPDLARSQTMAGVGAASSPETISAPPTPPQSPDEMYVSETAVPPPFPEDATAARRDQMWEDFQQMNPNLDYDAVAQQAIEMGGGGGKSVPGGTFTELLERDLPVGQRDEDLAAYIKELAIENQRRELMDPRRSTYDPEAYEVLVNERATDKASAAEMMQAQAAQTAADASMKLANMGRTRYGSEFAGSGRQSSGSDPKYIAAAAKEIEETRLDPSATPEQRQEAERVSRTIGVLLAAGRHDEAQELIKQFYGISLPVPSGVADLAAAEGGTPVGNLPDLVYRPPSDR